MYAIGTCGKLIMAKEMGKGSGSDSAYWVQLKQEARRYRSPMRVVFIRRRRM